MSRIELYAHEIYTAAQRGNIEHLDIALINRKNRYGLIALMISVVGNNVLALKTLLSASADPNVSNYNSSYITALTMAVGKNRVECVKELIRAGAFFTCERGLEALKLARDHNFLDAVVEGDEAMKKYVKQDSDKWETAFYIAFKNKCFDLITELVNAGGSISLRSFKYEDITGNTHLATLLMNTAKVNLNESFENGETAYTGPCKLSQIDMMKLFVDAGSDINCVDTHHRTPFINSIREVNFETTQFLLEHGADISKVDIDGMTALMWAAKTNNRNVLDLLLDLKPEVNCVDLKHTTALAHAVMSRNVQIVAKLIQAGADVNIASNCQVECTAIVFYKQNELTKYLLECGADVNLICDSLCSPLFVAVLNNDTELVKLLIKQGAIVDKGRDSELMVALEYGNIEMAIAVLEIGANSYLRDKNNTPALMIAVEICKQGFLCLFVAYEADVNVQNVKGETPLMMACRRGNVEAVKYLLSVGADVNAKLISAVKEPWPLVKLAFIEVSTLLGLGPMREEKLKQTKLPPRLQQTLMFQEPISRLPVEDWSKIPLCFDPVQYETLPCPRPLLYYWPVGHKLVNEVLLQR
ncbi:putative ankyrin repeat protein RF_0381 [Physella acuta]|uniref:putative ankyrin repeat protein RF_0381 n=1 Tax=Physella acuta TaxID=109671 RepID=UPI0027DE2B4C|nr:putative ankyrin repeat protein RF_0381 [Physella acuta]